MPSPSKGLRLALFVIFALATARAADRFPLLQTPDHIFTNVTVTTVTPTDLYFSHAGGMGNVKLKDLEPKLQQQFRYDPTKAANIARAQEEATRQYYIRKAAEKPPEIAPEPEPEPAAVPEAPPADRPAGFRLETVKAKRFLGTEAPQFVVEKWLTATPATPGKFLLIDFWATWCAPCRAIIPNLNAMQEKFKDQLVIVGLSDESESAVKLMTTPKIEYAVAIDTKTRMKRAVEVTAIPHAMLMDPQGIVRFEGNPHYLTEDALAKLLVTYAQ